MAASGGCQLHLDRAAQPRRAGAGLSSGRGFPGRRAKSAMVLGDNIFFGHGLPEMLAVADARDAGGTVFGYHVADPERYGVVAFDDEGRVSAIVEKPEAPAVEFRGDRALLSWTVARPNWPRRSSLAAGRAGDHRPAGGLPRRRQACRSNGWAAALPGSIPARMAACWMPATSCARWRSVRACRSAAPTRSPIARAGSAARRWPSRAKLFQKNAYGRYLAGILKE